MITEYSLHACRWLIRFTDISPTSGAAQGETPFHVAAALGQNDVIKVSSELLSLKNLTLYLLLKVMLSVIEKDAKGSICTVQDQSGMHVTY